MGYANYLADRFMDAHIAQWIGCRPQQQDAYKVLHEPAGSLFVVCDGMGGHADGAAASSLASEIFAETFAAEKAHSLTERLRAALTAANTAVGGYFRQTGGYGGTTLVAAYVGNGILRWISVGDSGLYLCRAGRIQRLNADHSMRAVLREYSCGCGLTAAEINSRGHCLRSALTGEPLTLVDAPDMPYPLLPGDTLLLSTDGAEDVLEDAAVWSTVSLNTPGVSPAVAVVEACRRLDNPHADNVTVVSMQLR